MNELNEKLAKWAGFVKTKSLYGPWQYPKDVDWFPLEAFRFDELPNFTNSLDACFKHLVPRLEKDYWIIIDPPNKTVIIVYGFVQEAEGIGETSALSLCNAIEKIIDGV